MAENYTMINSQTEKYTVNPMIDDTYRQNQQVVVENYIVDPAIDKYAIKLYNKDTPKELIDQEVQAMHVLTNKYIVRC